jgi:hypothetical protein
MKNIKVNDSLPSLASAQETNATSIDKKRKPVYYTGNGKGDSVRIGDWDSYRNNYDIIFGVTKNQN